MTFIVRCLKKTLPVLVLSLQSFAMDQPLKSFSYSEIESSGQEMMSQFQKKGAIIISEAPEFSEIYNQFLKSSREFIMLSAEEKKKCSPLDNYTRGWAQGIETFNSYTDSFKGTYSATVPDQELFNIWPNTPSSFRQDYLNLANVIHQTGMKILSSMNMAMGEFSGFARMLYYSPVYGENDDKSPYWCGLHRDHGFFTGLCPEIYSKDGNYVNKPEGSGLYILDEAISPPNNVLMFQIGEWMELATDGAVKATDHYVKKAYGGYDRYTFAYFFDASNDWSITCSNPDVLEKYQDRYKPGMTFKDWDEASVKKYNPEQYDKAQEKRQ